MKKLPDFTGRTFGYLFVVRRAKTPKGMRYLCRCKCGEQVFVSPSSLNTGHTKSCGCFNKERLKEVHTGHSYNVGRTPANFQDVTGRQFGKLTTIERDPNKERLHWLCKCECGRIVSVNSSNLLSGKSSKCQKCSNIQDITGQKQGLLTAESFEYTETQPLWTFRCDCGNTIQGTVREFGHKIRSCGCHDSTRGSWGSMMNRCYKETNNRYGSYGGRGITVCKRWHIFENFVADMGERPKRHNLGRKHAEKNYCPSNCMWEHVSKNCRDTANSGMPTKPGRKKNALPRFPKNGGT